MLRTRRTTIPDGRAPRASVPRASAPARPPKKTQSRSPAPAQPAVRAPEPAQMRQYAQVVVSSFFDGVLRNIAQLDVLLAQWAAAAATDGTPEDAVERFMRRVLLEPADVRVSNGTLYLTQGRALGIHYTQLGAEEARLLGIMIKHYRHFFSSMRAPLGTDILPEYAAFRFNPAVEAAFPRAEICARFTALALLPAARLARGGGSAPLPPPVVATPVSALVAYTGGISGNGGGGGGGAPPKHRFVATHRVFALAAGRVQARAGGRAGELLRATWAVLRRGWELVGLEWDPAAAVYPVHPAGEARAGAKSK